MKCVDASCSAEPISSVLEDRTPHGASIARGSNGFPIIAYVISNSDINTYYRQLKVATCLDASCTRTSIVPVTTGLENVGIRVSVTVGADGMPILIYYEYKLYKNLRIARCTTPTCSGRSIMFVKSTSHTSIGYPLSTVGADGQPVIAYRYSRNSSLDVIKCQTALCSAYPTKHWFTRFVSDSSLAVLPDGTPIVAYRKSGELLVTYLASIQ